MSYTFVISNSGSRIDAEFNPPLELNLDKNYEMALVNLETYWSFPNINEKNNQFHFSDDKKKYGIKIPKGAYELRNINDYIQLQLEERSIKKHSITLAPNPNTLRCVMNIAPEFTVDFSGVNTIASILGFENKIYPHGTHQSENIVKIITINSLLVHNNIIGHSYINGSLNPVLYSFFPSTGVGEKIIQEPKQRLYLPVTLKTISGMTTWLTDQDNQDIDLQNENLTIRLHIREQKSY